MDGTEGQHRKACTHVAKQCTKFKPPKSKSSACFTRVPFPCTKPETDTAATPRTVLSSYTLLIFEKLLLNFVTGKHKPQFHPWYGHVTLGFLSSWHCLQNTPSVHCPEGRWDTLSPPSGPRASRVAPSQHPNSRLQEPSIKASSAEHIDPSMQVVLMQHQHKKLGIVCPVGACSFLLNDITQ